MKDGAGLAFAESNLNLKMKGYENLLIFNAAKLKL